MVVQRSPLRSAVVRDAINHLGVSGRSGCDIDRIEARAFNQTFGKPALAGPSTAQNKDGTCTQVMCHEDALPSDGGS